jgi:hypothetical protein
MIYNGSVWRKTQLNKQNKQIVIEDKEIIYMLFSHWPGKSCYFANLQEIISLNFFFHFSNEYYNNNKISSEIILVFNSCIENELNCY